MDRDPPFVDMWRAVQLVAEMLPDGMRVAPAMTKAAIVRGFGLFVPAGSKELLTFQSAAEKLARAIASPTVSVTVADKAGRRGLTEEERSFQLDIREGLLRSPFNLNLGPPLREIAICVADLKNAVSAALDPPRLGGNKAKQHAVAEIISEIGARQLELMGQAEWERRIVAMVPKRNPGVTISPKTVSIRVRAAIREAKRAEKPT